MSSLVSKVIVDGSECKKINYTGATYKFEADELFEISDANYLPNYARFESDFSFNRFYIWPCHFGISIGNGCYYVTTPQFCKRFYNIYATPEDRITQNTPEEGYIEFSKFYDKFYSSIDNPELMYHYDSTHKIFYIIQKAYLMYNPDKASGQGGHGSSEHWYWPRYYVMSVPREVGGNIVCLGQQYNEGCLDVLNNQIVFNKVITEKKYSGYTDANIKTEEVRVTLPNNSFIKCYTENNPRRDPDDVPSLNTYGTISKPRMKKLPIFEKETISIKEMSQKYYFLFFVELPDNFVVIEMEIVQNSSLALGDWQLNIQEVGNNPAVANWARYDDSNIFSHVRCGDYTIPYFIKSDTNGYTYNFVTKIHSIYVAVVPANIPANFDNNPWDLDSSNINGPLIRQPNGYTRDGNMYSFGIYGDKNYTGTFNMPSLSYLLDHCTGMERFYNHEFSVVRSNLYVN